MGKTLILSLLTLGILFSACKKDDDEKCTLTDPAITVPASEITALETYLATKGITNAVKDPRGFYYTVQNPGTGATAGVCNSITINYTGKLTSDVIFDQTTTSPATFTLGELITGWIKGIPLIKSGGRITLYLPPSLGYGSRDFSVIPGNSILIFDIELLNVL